MFTRPDKPEKPSFDNLIADVESYAPGLSDEEVYSALGIDVDKASDGEKLEYKMALTRGRARANKKAVDLLFNQMATKGGEKACIDYLKQFADKWPKDGEYESGKGGGTFKVDFG